MTNNFTSSVFNNLNLRTVKKKRLFGRGKDCYPFKIFVQDFPAFCTINYFRHLQWDLIPLLALAKKQLCYEHTTVRPFRPILFLPQIVNFLWK